jgi:hypothetical protein
MVGEDLEPSASEDRLPLLQAVDNHEHLFIVRGVVSLSVVEGTRVEGGWAHRLVVLALAVITTDGMVAAICNEENWVWFVILCRLIVIPGHGAARNPP